RTDDIFHDTDFPFNHSKTLTGSALAAGIATIDINGPIGAEEEAWVTCECVITTDNDTKVTVPKDVPPKPDRDAGQKLDRICTEQARAQSLGPGQIARCWQFAGRRHAQCRSCLLDRPGDRKNTGWDADPDALRRLD